MSRFLCSSQLSQVLWVGGTDSSPTAHDLSLALVKTPLQPAQAGQSLDLGGGARLELLRLGKSSALLILD